MLQVMPPKAKAKKKATEAGLISSRLRERRSEIYDEDVADEEDAEDELLECASDDEAGAEAQAAPVAAGRGRGRGRGRGKARGAAPAAAPPAGSGGRGSAAGYTWVDAGKHAWRPRAAFAGEPDPKLGPAFDGLTVYNRPHEYFARVDAPDSPTACPPPPTECS